MKNKNLFWGFFFLMLAIFVIGSQTGSFGKIGIMSIVATFFFVTIVIHSLQKGNFFGVFIPVAFLYMIYSKPLSLMYISPWLLILSAVLTSIGFSLLFGRRLKKDMFSHDRTEHFSHSNENIDDNNPYAKVTLGSSSKYLHSDCLQGGNFISTLGELEVYFDQVQLGHDGAEIFLDCKLGSIQLYVPMHWNVVDNMHLALGEINNTRSSKFSENAPQLTLVGNVTMGSVEIHYVKGGV